MLKTARLSIRRISAADWKAVQTIWTEVAKTEYAQYDQPKDTSDEAVKARIERWASFAERIDHLFFAICLKDAVIGYVAFNQKGTAYDLGYCFHPDYHGQGFARESVSALLSKLKAKGITKVTAGTALKNTPSINLLLSLGFHQTGVEKVSFYKNEAGQDIVFDGGRFEWHP